MTPQCHSQNKFGTSSEIFSGSFNPKRKLNYGYPYNLSVKKKSVNNQKRDIDKLCPDIAFCLIVYFEIIPRPARRQNKHFPATPYRIFPDQADGQTHTSKPPPS